MKPATAKAEHRQIYFDLALTFAQRALAAREIFRRAAALIFRRLRTGFPAGSAEIFPARDSRRDCRRSICAFRAAMRLSLATERLRISFVLIASYSRNLFPECKALNFLQKTRSSESPAKISPSTCGWRGSATPSFKRTCPDSGCLLDRARVSQRDGVRAPPWKPPAATSASSQGRCRVLR